VGVGEFEWEPLGENGEGVGVGRGDLPVVEEDVVRRRGGFGLGRPVVMKG